MDVRIQIGERISLDDSVPAPNVEVVLGDGTVHAARFIEAAALERALHVDETTQQSQRELVHLPNMVVVERFDVETVRIAVDDLLQCGDFEWAFAPRRASA